MKLTDKINFKQPKYMLPLIIYLPLLGTAYFVFDMFDTELAEKKDANMQTTEYLNPNLPQAQIKSDGIGGKYENMLNSYGKIEDHSAVNNIEIEDNNEKEEFQSKYSDEELRKLDAEAAERTAEMERQKGMQKTDTDKTESEALAELNKALAQARLKAQQETGLTDTGQQADETNPANRNISGSVNINDKSRNAISEESEPTEVVKKVKVSSDYFNTLAENEKEANLIKAIIDEDVKATDGTRIRLRLLDDVEIGELVVPKGSYLYATMSGFGSQRVKGNIKSMLIDDELVKINLSIYDTDGMEGLYVPSSSFRETTKDVASSAASGNMEMNNGTNTGNSMTQWAAQAMTNAYQKTSNAIGKAIKKNKVKLKYGTFVYLINSKESKKNK
ncbi:conjugative transposon TraM protein [Parabacteroides sp. HGS0025]|jgi:conjugative transposon TraM protein|uniref:conjugative transposon protein TraM n=1 Tax=Parabacteroides sp. HGS0025 TaxID=1078087 RepID=UPI0006171579|nr:conjugative transposon protein TraM [Parabacteroides sp. HGS0025]KKB45448.1 conjugative transposon TraM protein [Parabacteroides sp. HGS0025]MBP9983990.1 conjugative transposon protein TraM [Prevotella sp.]